MSYCPDCAEKDKLIREQRDEIARLQKLEKQCWTSPEQWMAWCDIRILERAERAEAERDALLHAAEHGLSLMLSGADGETELRLYHRCSGCESALKLLQAHGKYLNAILPDAAIAKGKG